MKDISMYVVSHKKENKNYKDRQYIYVSDKTKDMPNNDNTGDNIHDKNPSFCELTAIYWIWKNDNESKYISIEHYRRVFGFNLFNVKNYYAISKEKALKLLTKYDIVVSYNVLHRQSIEFIYKDEVNPYDLKIVEDVIKNKYPEYLDDFNLAIKANYGYVCNMMIVNKEWFNDYCKWLFDILFDVDKKVNLNGRKGNQIRYAGYLGEILMNVYLFHHKELKIKSKPLVFTAKNRLIALFKLIRLRLIFLVRKKKVFD